MGRAPSRAPESQLQLPPGFRFYPTDEELVIHYLCKKAASEPFSVPIIAEVELYKFNPWDLPDKALFGEKEWYFFSPRDRKYPNGSRPNRAAGSGYWKATGTDKPISAGGGGKKVGVKKALVFYQGKAPKGVKTNWIMHEYRLADSGTRSAKRKGTLRLDDWVLCRIYKKTSSAQKAAAKERSESSCLDDVLASLPEIDDAKVMSIPRMSSLKAFAAEEVVEPSVSFYSGVNQGSAQYSGHSDMTMLNGEILPETEAAEVRQVMEESYRGQDCAQSSQEGGSSSLERSHLSNELSRQHSPPDSVEEDSVESTFSSLPNFSSAHFTGSFGQPYPFSFDGLPSPFGRLEPLGDGDYFNFSSDYLQRSVS